MDFQFILAGLSPLLSGILLYEYRKQSAKNKIEDQMREQQHAALVGGVEALLRDRLLHGMEEGLANGYAPISKAESLNSMYLAYHNLGGNGIVTETYKRFMALPHVPPDHQ